MLIGILLGTTAFIAISGMMLGFQVFIIDQLVNNDAHVRVSARDEYIGERSLDRVFFNESTLISWLIPPSGRRDNAYIEYPEGWFERLNRDPRVLAYSPQFTVQAIATRAKASIGARLVGIDPTRQMQVTNIRNYMREGSFTDIGGGGSRVIVGEGLLQKLGARVSETLLLSGGKSKPTPYTIIGSFRLGVKTLDETLIFGSLQDVQRLNSTPSRITDIAIRLVDVEKADEAAAEWALIGSDKVQSWSQANEGILSVFKTQDIVRISMTVSILLVAGFGIYNILSMAVNNKRREIAILRSIGYEPSDIVRLFLIQGVILGAIGGAAGCLIGYGVSRAMASIEVSGERGLGGNHMMIAFFPMIYARGFLLAFGSAAVASLLPARAAGKLEPIVIIRSEGS